MAPAENACRSTVVTDYSRFRCSAKCGAGGKGLRHLKCAGAGIQDLLSFYCTVIRTIMEYAVLFGILVYRLTGVRIIIGRGGFNPIAFGHQWWSNFWLLWSPIGNFNIWYFCHRSVIVITLILLGMYRIAIKIRPESDSTGYQMNYLAGSGYLILVE